MDLMLLRCCFHKEFKKEALRQLTSPSDQDHLPGAARFRLDTCACYMSHETLAARAGVEFLISVNARKRLNTLRVRTGKLIYNAVNEFARCRKLVRHSQINSLLCSCE